MGENTETLFISEQIGFDSIMERIRFWIWLVRWRLRGHLKNHDSELYPPFEGWDLAKGKWTQPIGHVCEWCHLLEIWCPTPLPDVEELVRVRADGSKDLSWQPSNLEVSLSGAIRKRDSLHA